VRDDLPNPYEYHHDIIRVSRPLPFSLTDPDYAHIPTPRLEYDEFVKQWVYSPERGTGAVWVDENGERVSPVSFGKEEPIKKLDSPLMGVREWIVGKDGGLRSTGMGGVWSEGAQKATCRSGRGVYGLPCHTYDRYALDPTPSHPAPHKGCGCGLYAFYTQDSLIKHGDNIASRIDGVSGVVSAWGKTIRSEYGFRAEYMKLEALIMEHAERSFWGTTLDLRNAHQSLAKKHGVPLIKSYEVSAFMGLSGGSVMECEEKPSKPVSPLYDMVSKQLASTFDPARYIVSYHSDYHSADGSRTYWVEYNDGTTAPMKWSKQ
jgi:hypothetical protein